MPYLSENDASATNKMMADMVIKPTGDVDRDFVSMMTPHLATPTDPNGTALKGSFGITLVKDGDEWLAEMDSWTID